MEMEMKMKMENFLYGYKQLYFSCKKQIIFTNILQKMFKTISDTSNFEIGRPLLKEK